MWITVELERARSPRNCTRPACTGMPLIPRTLVQALALDQVACTASARKLRIAILRGPQRGSPRARASQSRIAVMDLPLSEVPRAVVCRADRSLAARPTNSCFMPRESPTRASAARNAQRRSSLSPNSIGRAPRSARPPAYRISFRERVPRHRIEKTGDAAPTRPPLSSRLRGTASITAFRDPG